VRSDRRLVPGWPRAWNRADLCRPWRRVAHELASLPSLRPLLPAGGMGWLSGPLVSRRAKPFDGLCRRVAGGPAPLRRPLPDV